MIRVSEYKLPTSEKEDREVKDLIHKKPPRSRKYKNKRGPKHDNRTRRVNEKDKDLEINTVKGDPDMSLKSSSVNDAMAFIAIRLATDWDKLEKAIKTYEKELRKSSNSIADQFVQFAEDFYILPAAEGESSFSDDGVQDIEDRRSRHLQLQQDLAKYLSKASPEHIVDSVVGAWPQGDKTDFGSRAAVIGALIKSVNAIRLPESLKVPFLRKNVKDFVNDRTFIQRIIEASKKKSGKKIDEELVPRFAQLAAAYRLIKENPATINASSLSAGVESLSRSIIDQFEELSALNTVMEDWHDALAQLQHDPQKVADLGKSSKDYDQIISSIDGFFKGDQKLVDVDTYLDEMSKYAVETVGGVPESLSELFPSVPSVEEPEVLFEPDVDAKGVEVDLSEEPVEIDAKMVLEGEEYERVVQYYVDMLKEACADQDDAQINKFLKELHNEVQANIEEDMARVAARIMARGALTSNEVFFIRDMTARKATYHGVTDLKGNPVSPTNTGYRSYDKRFFGKDHQESIVKAAKELLKDGWLSSGWDGGAKDAPYRAALDLAIHTADDSLYQSKIDVETYDLLLNQLTGWGYDTFSETMLPFKKGGSRSAAMKPGHQAILKIANDIRQNHPELSLKILKSLRSLVSSEADVPPGPPVAPVASPPSPEEMQILQENTPGLDALHDMITQTLGDEINPSDIDAFLEQFDEMFEGLQEKVASSVPRGMIDFVKSPVPLAVLARVSSIGAADLPRLAALTKANLPKIRAQKDAKGLLLSVAALSRAFAQQIGSTVGASVSLGELVRIAHNFPETRSALVPYIQERRQLAAAKAKPKKKKGDKDKSKVSQKKSDEKDDKGGKEDKGGKGKKVPFGGKQAPPFGGKKSPAKDKKAAVIMTDSDLNWTSSK